MQSPAEASSAPSSSSRYEFWNEIGKPQFVVAPMVDHSELAYRMLTRRYGATLVYTQMFNANSFVSAKDYRSNNFKTTEGDRPLIVRLFDRSRIAAAADAMFQVSFQLHLHCPFSLYCWLRCSVRRN
jgi:tRNA-dihydrouridine synthase 1